MLYFEFWSFAYDEEFGCIRFNWLNRNTGSEVCDNINIRVLGLSAAENIDKLEIQARKHKPSIVSVLNAERGKELKTRLKDTNIKVVWGIEGMIELVTIPDADTVLTSVWGLQVLFYN